MKKHEAAAKVNEALAAAGVAKALHDPKAKGLLVRIGGQTHLHEFKHGVHAIEQRKMEIAHLRAQLVADLLAAPEETAVEVEPEPTQEEAKA